MRSIKIKANKKIITFKRITNINEDRKTMNPIIQFLLQRIGVKMNAQKLKIYISIVFIISEKIFVKFEKLLPFYLDFYIEMIEDEINLANISKDQKILHVGSGSIPATCILIERYTNNKITGIDKDPKSVEESKRLLSKINTNSKIKIKNYEARKYPINEFDIIIISNGIYPYYELLYYISKNMNKDAIVILRTHSQRNNELLKVDKFLKDIFIMGDKVVREKYALLTSILLYKKSN